MAVRRTAVLAFSSVEEPVSPGGVVRPGRSVKRLHLAEQGQTRFPLEIGAKGDYGVFTEHGPEEFQLRLLRDGVVVEPRRSQSHAEGHTHDESVSSVGIQIPGALYPRKLNDWMAGLLRERGADIFRMKGILDVKGSPNRVVFQGVHMLFDARADRPWKPGESRANQLVFIGRNLDRASLVAGFRSCLA